MKKRPLILTEHRYIDRATGFVCKERPFGDRVVNYLYSMQREEAALLYRLLGSPWVSGLLGWINYDFPLGENIFGIRRFLRRIAIDLTDCLDRPEALNTARKIFERQIRYWQCRPMTDDEKAVVCPADSRVIIGSLRNIPTCF